MLQFRVTLSHTLLMNQNAFLHYKEFELYFGEKKLSDLTKDYQQPVYVYDLKFIVARLKLMQQVLKKNKIFYAMKANSHLDVMRTLQKNGAGADVVSAGEIERALQSGFKPEDIVFSGVGKTEKEINRALELKIYQINVESMPEMQRIAKLAKAKEMKAQIALRLNPNIDIKTHPYIATGLHENKFGMELSALEQIQTLLQEHKDSLELVGLSLHLGSQMHNLSGFRDGLKLLKPVYLNLKQKFPTLQRFDVGGGLGIFYDEMNLEKENSLLAHYAEIIDHELKDLNCEIQSEPGRWLVGHAGVLLTQIQYVKDTPYRTFLVVDAGMNHLIRPSLYDAYHGIFPMKQDPKRAHKAYDVVGPICESSDFFAKDRKLQESKQDEFLVIADAGAYGFSMASHYNLKDEAKEICI